MEFMKLRLVVKCLLTLSSVSTIFVLVLLLGKILGLDQAPVAAVCSAIAISGSAIVGLLTFQHNQLNNEKQLFINQLNSEEQWLINFRELHREFWSDSDITDVRKWICCDDAYREELLPVLKARQSGQVSSERYTLLETLDRFCALMTRLAYINTKPRTEDQNKAWESLGYYYWLARLRDRHEIQDYITKHWHGLDEEIKKARVNETWRIAAAPQH